MVKFPKFARVAGLLSAAALLAAPGVSRALETGIAIDKKTTFTSYMDYIKSVFSFAMKLGAALTVLMIIYAAIKYITSQGNSSATNEAKDIIIGSLSGFAMLLLIYLILNVLGLQDFAF